MNDSPGSLIAPADKSALQTKDRILDTAERLFAEHGLDRVSVRDITTAAEANVGAVNYYFGSKEGLVMAVFDRRLTPITRERLAALDHLEAEAGGNPPTVEDLLGALIRPAVEHALDAKWGSTSFARLMGRLLSEPGERLVRIKQVHFDVLARRLDALLLRAVRGLSQEELSWRMTFTVGALHHLLFMIDHTFPCCMDQHPDSETQVRRLVTYAAAGLRAA